MNKTKKIFLIKAYITSKKNEFLYIYENEEGINQTHMKFILNNFFFHVYCSLLFMVINNFCMSFMLGMRFQASLYVGSLNVMIFMIYKY